MKASDIKIKEGITILHDIDGLVGKTITSTDTFLSRGDECIAIWAGGDLVVLKGRHYGDSRHCEAFDSVDTCTREDLEYEAWVKLGILDEESHREYLEFKENERKKAESAKKRAATKKRRQEEAQDFEKYLELHKKFGPK